MTKKSHGKTVITDANEQTEKPKIDHQLQKQELSIFSIVHIESDL